MILVPEQYKHDCERENTPFGKFIRSYYHKEKVSTSKFQQYLSQPENKKDFMRMTKLEFLYKFVLLPNDEYSLDDFLNIDNSAIRGFLYESIWDIVIKCNLVPEFHGMHHLDGRIETLRNTRKDFVNDLSSLKEIENMYTYLEKSKMISSSSGGVSDITLSEKQNPNHYVLISSKYYLNEKNIEHYDVAKLYQAMKNTRTTFDIILLVNDKRTIQRRMSKSFKTEVKESISTIYDTSDLASYYNRLRLLFASLHYFNKNSNIKNYFTADNFKPLIPFKFEVLLFFNSLMYGNKTEYVWNSPFSSYLCHCVLFHVFMTKDKTHCIVCNKQIENNLRNLFDSYYGFDEICISFKTLSVYKKTKSKANVLYVFDTNEKLYLSEYCQTIIYLGSESPIVDWSIKDIVALQNGEWLKNSAFDTYVIEQSLLKLYGTSFVLQTDIGNDHDKYFKRVTDDFAQNYAKRGQFFVITEKFNGTGIESLCDYVFARSNDFHEKHIVMNRIKSNMNDFTKIVWFVEKEHDRETYDTILKTKKWLQGITIHIEHCHNMRNIFFAPDVIIVSDASVDFSNLFKYIHQQYEKTNNDLCVVDFDKHRIGMWRQYLENTVHNVIDQSPMLSR